MIELSEAERQFSEWLDIRCGLCVSFLCAGSLLVVVVAVSFVADVLTVHCSSYLIGSVLSVVFACS